MVGDNLFGKWLGVLCNWLIIDVLEHQVLVDDEGLAWVGRACGDRELNRVLVVRTRFGVWRSFWVSKAHSCPRKKDMIVGQAAKPGLGRWIVSSKEGHDS